MTTRDDATHPDLLVDTPVDSITERTEPKRSEPIGIPTQQADVIDAPDERRRECAQPQQYGSGEGEERGDDVVDRGFASTGLDVGVGILATAEHCAGVTSVRRVKVEWW